MTTRFKIVCGVALLIAIVFLGVAITSNTASASRFQKKPPVTPQPGGSGGAQTYSPGVPAIPISTPSGLTANAIDSASTPAFTRDDVIAYFNKHGFYAGPLVKGAHLKILTIQFVTAKQASALMKGEHINRPDSYLVCYVKVQGPFQMSSAEVPPNAKEPTANIGDAVFDAHTGNMLVWGVY